MTFFSCTMSVRSKEKLGSELKTIAKVSNNETSEHVKKLEDQRRLRSVPFEKAENNVTYCEQFLEFRVICLSRNFLTTAVADRAKLHHVDDTSGTTTYDDILYMPRVLLLDVYSKKLHVAFLHPKFDSLLARYQIQSGSLIFVKQYMYMKPDLVPNKATYIKKAYFEIIELDVKQTTCDGLDFPDDMKDVVQRFESTCLPFAGITKLNFWCDMVPCFPKSLSMCCLSDLGPLLKDAKMKSVSYLATSWEHEPDNSFPVLVRVLSKTKLSYYKPTKCVMMDFPTKSTLIVADKTGSCVLVMWDFTNQEELYSRIHLGSVLYIKNYKIQRSAMPRFPYKRDHPKMFPVELSVNYKSHDNQKTSRQDVMLVTIPPTYAAKNLTVADEQYNFAIFGKDRKKPESSIIDVSGVVVGISRFYRVLQNKTSLPGKTFVYRYIEIYDPRNNCSHQLEVFVSSLLKCHQNMSLGDSVIFTFVRVLDYNSLIYNCKLTYLTTTQDTEVFVLPHGKSKVDNVGPYPPTIIRELARLKVVRRKPSMSNWIGGFCWFSWANLSAQSVREVIAGQLHFQKHIEILQNLLLRGTKTFGLSGVIARIDYCVVHEMEVNSLSHEITGIVKEMTEVYNNPEMATLLSLVQFYGSKRLNLHTFPVRGNTELALDIHKTLWFPPTNIFDILNTKEKSLTITDKDLLCHRFFRILIIPNKQSALWCIFVPPKPVNPSTKVTFNSLLNLLCVKYIVDSTRGGFPAYNDFQFSKSDLENLSQTGDEITNREFTFILQAYKAGVEEVELSLCRIAYEIGPNSLANN